MTSGDDRNQENPKKLKVIDWQVADAMASEFDPSREPPSSKAGWKMRAVGVVVLLLVAFVTVRGVQVYHDMRKEAEKQYAQAGAGRLDPGLPLSESFVSRPRAELAREDVLKRLLDARRSIDGSPHVMQRLLSVERAFQEGERMLNGRDYANSYAKFEETREMLNTFNDEIRFKNEAMAARDDFLVLFNRYDSHRNIAAEDYEAAFSLASEGRFFLDNGSYHQARERFKGAVERLERIGERLVGYVERQLVEGQSAIAAGESRRAMELFNSVLEIDETNDAALKGIRRAETLDRVYPMLRKATDLEESGDWVEANDLYATAYELDPMSARAQEGMYRTARLVKDRAFNLALEEARVHADRGEWYLVIDSYKAALEVYPEHEEVKKLLEEARELEFETRLVLGLNKAIEFERGREWDLAREAYLEVLEIDDRNEEARAGLLRTGKMIRTILRYEKLVELSMFEARSGDFQSAIRYFNDAMSIKPDYLPLTVEATQLKSFLDRQSRPVMVTITSDNRTWVSIAGYELLGKLRERNIRILPGRYRVVGRRKGYEDVNIELQVVNGQELPPINVVASRRTG